MISLLIMAIALPSLGKEPKSTPNNMQLHASSPQLTGDPFDLSKLPLSLSADPLGGTPDELTSQESLDAESIPDSRSVSGNSNDRESIVMSQFNEVVRALNEWESTASSFLKKALSKESPYSREKCLVLADKASEFVYKLRSIPAALVSNKLATLLNKADTLLALKSIDGTSKFTAFDSIRNELQLGYDNISNLQSIVHHKVILPGQFSCSVERPFKLYSVAQIHPRRYSPKIEIPLPAKNNLKSIVIALNNAKTAFNVYQKEAQQVEQSILSDKQHRQYTQQICLRLAASASNMINQLLKVPSNLLSDNLILLLDDLGRFQFDILKEQLDISYKYADLVINMQNSVLSTTIDPSELDNAVLQFKRDYITQKINKDMTQVLQYIEYSFSIENINEKKHYLWNLLARINVQGHLVNRKITSFAYTCKVSRSTIKMEPDNNHIMSIYDYKYYFEGLLKALNSKKVIRVQAKLNQLQDTSMVTEKFLQYRHDPLVNKQELRDEIEKSLGLIEVLTVIRQLREEIFTPSLILTQLTTLFNDQSIVQMKWSLPIEITTKSDALMLFKQLLLQSTISGELISSEFPIVVHAEIDAIDAELEK